MKAVLVFLFTWIFLVPAAITIFLFSTVLAMLLPDKYFVLLWCALLFCGVLPMLQILIPVHYVEIRSDSVCEDLPSTTKSQEEKHEVPRQVGSGYWN